MNPSIEFSIFKRSFSSARLTIKPAGKGDVGKEPAT